MKNANNNTKTASRVKGRAAINRNTRKREPISVEMLVHMAQAVVNECLNADISVRLGKSKAGGLLLALDTLTLNDEGLIVVRQIAAKSLAESSAANIGSNKSVVIDTDNADSIRPVD